MKIVKLTESDLRQIVEKVLREDSPEINQAKNVPTNKVTAIQNALIRLGYNVGPTGADGKYGPNTVAAVKKYQMDNGIKQTGFVGPITAGKLGVQSMASGGAQTTTGKQQQTTTGKQKTTTKPKVSSERQNNVNFAYCNSEGGVIIAKGSKVNGMKWNLFVKKYSVTNQEIEIAKKSCPKTQNKNYKLTVRLDRELEYIKSRGLDKTPFFVYDPKDNLIYLFDKGGVLVDYSQVVDGADQQKEDVPAMTHEQWCQLSGLDTSPYKCTDKTTKQRKDPFYSVLANTAERFLSKGIYKINMLTSHAGYEGVGKNTFHMVDDKGKPIAAAIHGIPKLPARLKASQELESLLKKDIASGKVPEKYLKSIKTIANANQSFGCIGVPAKFIENPKVQSLAPNAKVFVMGEGKDYLVQNAEEYFNKLSGDGERCVSPTRLASSMSNMA